MKSFFIHAATLWERQRRLETTGAGCQPRLPSPYPHNLHLGLAQRGHIAYSLAHQRAGEG